jgi:hypothetical protein
VDLFFLGVESSNAKFHFTAILACGSLVAGRRRKRDFIDRVPHLSQDGRRSSRWGWGMGMPQIWHKRQAMVLAGQLPENTAEALLVLQAMHELLETFLSVPEGAIAARVATNVLPFIAG